MTQELLLNLLQPLVVAIISLVAFLGKKVRPLCVLFLLMPFNSIIKDLFILLTNNGAIFSIWKEVVVFIFFFKVYKKNHIYTRALTPFFLVELLFFLVMMVVGVYNHDTTAALLKFRDLIIPQFLVLGVLSMPINQKVLYKLIKVFSIAVVITCILGLFEAYGGGRFSIALLKRAPIQIGLDGTVYYPAAWMIMGYYRMFGVLDSPNQFGIFLSLFAIYCISLKSYIVFSKKELFYGKLVFVGAVLCILFSFSRTSVFVLLVTLALRYANKRNAERFVMLGIIVAIGTVALCYVSESFSEVLIGTFNGSEASAADRKNNFTSGIQFLFSNLGGFGLGSSYPHGSVPPVYFAESAYINLCVEAGIMGLAMFLTFYVLVLKILKRYKSFDLGKYAYALVWATIIASFVSINPMECIYTYYFWVYIGIAIKLCYQQKYEQI